MLERHTLLEDLSPGVKSLLRRSNRYSKEDLKGVYDISYPKHTSDNNGPSRKPPRSPRPPRSKSSIGKNLLGLGIGAGIGAGAYSLRNKLFGANDSEDDDDHMHSLRNKLASMFAAHQEE